MSLKHPQEQRRERYWRLRDALDPALPRVGVLRPGLQAVTGRAWADANSDDLMAAADKIITGRDADKKAKFIAACRQATTQD